jgi:hypothetical protein
VQVFDLITRCKRPHRRLKKFLIKYRSTFPGILKKHFSFEFIRC